ncbi:MAG: Fe-S cluster assembly ATPase SufC [Candidatus Marsarchaeota archaeon]|jgi:Fe-S cluster assembly ATP-binding protein|nr:Fe-S cluster assembly ATPase SufC [Candidatus Marsarchaeota archaeon]
MILEIKDLHVEAEGKEIVKGLSLTVKGGEQHVLMGPNGSGKTTLAKAIMGHPLLKVTHGDILVDGESIKGMKPNERAKCGLFLEFQSPTEIEGLGFMNFLNTARGSAGNTKPFKEFMAEVKERSEKLKMKEDLIGRSLNYGFSGGEKKKVEILQMAVLKPKIAILDEPDSGLDIDAVKLVAENVNELQRETKLGLLIITHYSRILNYMQPKVIHIMQDGRIVREGGKELIDEIERSGYGLG